MELENLPKQERYQAFRTELRLRNSGGVIPVICPDAATVHSIIVQLKEDLDDTDASILEIGHRTDYTAFFNEMIANRSSAPRWMHLLGIEQLPESRQVDIFGFIFRISRQPEPPCCFILWTTRAFDRQLFYNLPDTHYNFSQWHDFSELAPDGTEESDIAGDVTDALQHTDVLDYINAVIFQFDNPGRDTDTRSLPISAMIDIKAGYLPVTFFNPKGDLFPVENLLRAFLKDDTVNFLTLAGAPGAGKTTVMVNYFSRLVRDFRNAPEGRRIPLFIDMAGYDENRGLESFLSQWVKQNLGVSLSLFSLQDMLLRGRFVLFLDSFDRMNFRKDRFQVSNLMASLNKFTTRNIILENGVEKPQPANKVLLACPPHYIFRDISPGKSASGVYTDLYKDYAGTENHRLIRINPQKPDAEGMKAFVRMRSGDGITARNLLSILGDDPLLDHLKCRELLTTMLPRTVHFWKGIKEINLSDIFLVFTDEWIERDDWCFRLTPAGKRYLVRQLAARLARKSKKDRTGIHFSDLDPPSDTHIKEEYQFTGVDPFKSGVQSCEFIRQDPEGNYRFTHPAFLNFFIAADYLADLTAKTEPAIPYEDLPPEARTFLKLRLSAQKAELGGLNLSGVSLEHANFYQGRLAGVNLSKAVLKQAIFMNADLSGATLVAADFSDAQLTRAKLQKADLNSTDMSRARLRQADLSGANMNGAILQNCDLQGANLQQAKLAWADLREANLEGADLTGANLSDADLTYANLRGAILSKTNLTGTCFSHGDLTEALLKSAQMRRVDLSHAILVGAEILWSNLQEALMNFADISESKVRECNLNRSIMANLRAFHADLRRSTFHYAKLSGADLRESDLSESDFFKAKLNNANMASVNMSNAKFREANLSESRLSMAKMLQAELVLAILSDADMTWANLGQADLGKAKLVDANLNEADLSDVNLRYADLTGASLEGATLHRVDIRNAKFSKRTFAGADMTDAITQ